MSRGKRLAHTANPRPSRGRRFSAKADLRLWPTRQDDAGSKTPVDAWRTGLFSRPAISRTADMSEMNGFASTTLGWSGSERLGLHNRNEDKRPTRGSELSAGAERPLPIITMERAVTPVQTAIAYVDFEHREE